MWFIWGEKKQKQFRPDDFASYIARSARRSSSSGEVPSSGIIATPMLAPISCSTPPIVYGSPILASNRVQMAATLLLSSRFCSTMANSSPPMRAAKPLLSSPEMIRSATCRKRTSPVWWPRVSLITLNRSRSSSNSAAPRLLELLSSMAVRNHCASSVRLGKPVSISCSAKWVRCCSANLRAVISKPVVNMPMA